MANESRDPWDWRDIEVGRDDSTARLIGLVIACAVVVALILYRAAAWPFA